LASAVCRRGLDTSGRYGTLLLPVFSPETTPCAGFAGTGCGQEEQMTETVAKLAYKPVGIAGGLVAGALAGAVFRRIWKLVAHEDRPPTATDEERGWGEILAAAAVEGAVFGGVRAAVERSGATGFARATGVWP